MSIESVMPSNHLILCCPLLLMYSLFPSIRVFSNESVLCIRWPKYWSFSFNISPSNEYSGLISFSMDWCDLLTVQGTLKGLPQHYSSKASVLQCSAFFMVQLPYSYMTTGKTIALTIQTFVGKVMSLLFNTLSRFVIAFLPRVRDLLIIHTYIYFFFHISIMVCHRILNMSVLYGRTLFLNILKSPQILQHSLHLDLWTWTHLRCLVFSYCLLAYLRFQFPTNYICLSLPGLKITFLDRESKIETTCPVFLC